MNENMHRDEDDRLLTELRGLAARIDPVPEGVLDAARETLAWRTIDAELAELTYDSVLDDARVAAVRSGEESRLLTFEVPSLTVELEVVGEGERRQLNGQIVPAGAGRVEIRHTSGVIEVEADDLGRFAAGDVPRGPLSLRLHLEGAPPVTTDWVTL
jgi:hypothetical protein